ncbi:protease HTPX-like protein [Methanosarcina sp. MSH10X1]|uniref:M48 family metallopeptidase n=1 Tax=Methanosarcina sp. MSH10X1 TaxID=2507075 RepID=UPI000FFB7AC0|nr:M48 family metalloprotease [Methanosarcina sp. MSH10X1]RXA20917.1 protease HTPX-like protein [Methanosarcina sp. MSH10X1]
MGTFGASGSTEFPSVLAFILEALTKNVLVILGLSFLITLLFSYIYFRGSRWILKWYGAQKIQRNERTLLYSTLEELSAKAGIKTPEMLSFESEVPAIFTVVSGSKSFITVSTAMLEMFDGVEMEALLAHEIGHIKNGDVYLNTITAFLAGLVMSFPDLAMWGSMLSGFGQPEDPAPRFFKFMATALAAPPAAVIIHLTDPEKREFEADRTAVKLTGNPQALIKTLEFLENYIPLQPVTGKFNPGHFHLFSTHTQQIRGYLSVFISLFDTHPDIKDRIMQILKNSNQPEKEIPGSKYSRVPSFFDLRSWKLAMATSFISYISLLFGIIVLITFAIKDFNFLLNGIIAGLYIGAVLLLMCSTAALSRKGYYLDSTRQNRRKGHYLNAMRPARKKISLNPKQLFKHFMKKS